MVSFLSPLFLFFGRCFGLARQRKETKKSRALGEAVLPFFFPSLLPLFFFPSEFPRLRKRARGGKPAASRLERSNLRLSSSPLFFPPFSSRAPPAHARAGEQDPRSRAAAASPSFLPFPPFKRAGP